MSIEPITRVQNVSFYLLDTCDTKASDALTKFRNMNEKYLVLNDVVSIDIGYFKKYIYFESYPKINSSTETSL